MFFGQRVQVIKDTESGKGTLQFGTEVITSEDGSLSALLGASPGASTLVDIMLDLLKQFIRMNFQIGKVKLKKLYLHLDKDYQKMKPYIDKLMKKLSRI